jgi:predicted pyridoxine 5'-phosphate oxidase superfamily flavin-nucleotide-binding protein
MAKITQEMKTLAEKAMPFIFATASKEGKPNGVPIGLVRIISDDEVMLVDCFMDKSRQNLAENPMASVAFWDPETPVGYQFKGTARVETSGRNFDGIAQWMQERKFPFAPKAVVILKVEEIYHVGPDKDYGIRFGPKK